MTYANLADVYLGDVSGQVYEFLRTPRPCLFLNAHGLAWRGDPDYGHWRFGPVLEKPADLCAAVTRARDLHPEYRCVQAAGVAETFDLKAAAAGPASRRAAAAIAQVAPRLLRERGARVGGSGRGKADPWPAFP